MDSLRAVRAYCLVDGVIASLMVTCVQILQHKLDTTGLSVYWQPDCVVTWFRNITSSMINEAVIAM